MLLTFRVSLALIAIALMFFLGSAPRAGAESRPFAPNSFWNQPLGASASIDPRSPQIVRHFLALIRAEQRDGGPAITTPRWSVPVYTVPADQPTVRVAQQNSRGFSPALQAAWEAVPMPADARPASGRDRHLVVWQPSTDRLWEFWHLRRTASGWAADFGGAMDEVSRSSGVYGPEAWPGATTSWGGSASSLSLAGGLITRDDLRRGEIDHVLAFSSPEVRAGVFAFPAERSDGVSPNPLALPEGARLRLDPKLDLSRLAMPPLTRMIARAVQRYGMILRSRSGNVNFITEDPTPYGPNPFKGPNGYFEGMTSDEVLASFPWEGLQLLSMSPLRATS